MQKWGEERDCRELPRFAGDWQTWGKRRGYRDLQIVAKNGGHGEREGVVERFRELLENGINGGWA